MLLAALAGGAIVAASPAAAQGRAPNLVSACSGVVLPRPVVTDILSPVVTGIATPVQNTLNPLLGLVGAILPGVPATLNIQAAQLLTDAAAGTPITLQLLNRNGTIVGPADRCDTQSDTFQLTATSGLAIGGNRITGLGTAGAEAFAGETNAIALGDGARTGAGATGAVALGAGASADAANSIALGGVSVAARGALGGYTALGVAGPQASVGEVSVGAAGAERQITNVAAGSAATDAVNVAQLQGVALRIDGLDDAIVYDGAARDSVTLAGPAGTVIRNVAPGTVGAASTEAVNGAQLDATNVAVSALTADVRNGALGPVRYANAGTPGVPNGGVPSNDVTLVGASPAAVAIHNVAPGFVGPGSTDAVNGGQLATVTAQVAGLDGRAVQYDDATRARVTLGAGGAAPVALGNVAAGAIGGGSTEAVNGGQVARLGTEIAAMIGGASRYDPVTNGFDTQLTYAGQQFGSVQAAFDAVSASVTAGAGSAYVSVASAGPGAVASGAEAIAIGSDAIAASPNGVALGAGSRAGRGAQARYAAIGLAAPQTSAGEVSIGQAGAERQLTNVAAGSAATDAVNVAQLAGVQAQLSTLGDAAVRYDTADRSRILLGGAGGTTLSNVRAGAIDAGSTDAVNGAQLAATNGAVTTNATAITALASSIANGATGPVRYADAATPTAPNGGTRTNDVTLVGAADGPVAIHNVADGAVAAGSTDAVNGGQVYALGRAAANSLSYDLDAEGDRANSVTLSGGSAAPVLVTNVAAGRLAEGSTDAVNGGQLAATNQAIERAQAQAGAALSMGEAAVQYDEGDPSSVTLGRPGAAVTLRNMAPGVVASDAVNLGQLRSGLGAAVAEANAYTDARLAAMAFDLRSARKAAHAGTAGALAAAGLPQAFGRGKGMIAIGGGTYRGSTAIAVGASKAFDDGHTVFRLGATYDLERSVGASGGIGYQF